MFLHQIQKEITLKELLYTLVIMVKHHVGQLKDPNKENGQLWFAIKISKMVSLLHNMSILDTLT